MRAPAPASLPYGAAQSCGQAGVRCRQRQPHRWGWATGRRAMQPCAVHIATYCECLADTVRRPGS